MVISTPGAFVTFTCSAALASASRKPGMDERNSVDLSEMWFVGVCVVAAPVGWRSASVPPASERSRSAVACEPTSFTVAPAFSPVICASTFIFALGPIALTSAPPFLAIASMIPIGVLVASSFTASASNPPPLLGFTLASSFTFIGSALAPPTGVPVRSALAAIAIGFAA